MNQETKLQPNIKKTIPFFSVADMEASLRYYVDGLGFTIIYQWTPRGKIEWCCLQREGASLMLQEFRKDGHDAWTPEGKLGTGVSIFFICEDALAIYHEVIVKGIQIAEPYVGNNMWVVSMRDPDGYSIEFESDTDTPEETRYSEWYK